MTTPFPSSEKLNEKEERPHDQTELHSNFQTYLYLTEPPFSSTCVAEVDGQEDSAESSLHESVGSGGSRTEEGGECEDELESETGQGEEVIDNLTEERESLSEDYDKSHDIPPTSAGAESSHSEYLQFQSSSGYVADGSSLICTSPSHNTSQQPFQPISDHVVLTDDSLSIPSNIQIVGDKITSPLTDCIFNKSTKLQEQLCSAHNLLFDVEYDLELMEKDMELNQQRRDYLGQLKNIPEYLSMPEAPSHSPSRSN